MTSSLIALREPLPNGTIVGTDSFAMDASNSHSLAKLDGQTFLNSQALHLFGLEVA
jgi:hypothetical protein